MKYIVSFLALVLCLSGLGFTIALAAPVTFVSDTAFPLTSPVTNLTVLAGSVADLVTVNAGSMVVNMSSLTGGAFMMTSPRVITVSTVGTAGTVSLTCVANVQTVTISQPAGSAIYTLTPGVSPCSLSSTVPDVPTGISASVGNGQATVSFAAPGNNGGSTILYYTVTSNPGNIVASSTGSPIVLTGLTNGTNYTFTVTATNAVGSSNVSSVSNVVTPGVPIVSSGGGGTTVSGGSVGVASGYGTPFIASVGQTGGSSTSSATTTIGSDAALAQEIVQLQAQLATLLQQAANEGSSGSLGGASTGITNQLFLKNLRFSMLDPDVARLQHYLNTHGFPLAQSGPGSPGFETNRFGLATLHALQKFQRSIGLTSAGYFGPQTRGYVNAHR